MRNIQIGIVAIMAIWGKLIFVLAINSQSNHLGYDDIQRAFKKGRCQSCHPSIWREWERSFHAKAWTDPIYQQAASQIPNREATCDPCHAPEPVLSTGLGKMPKLRDTDRESGVSCLSCHMDQNGTMHGPEGSLPAGFHGDMINPNYAQDPMLLCATCHGQAHVMVHNQVSSFRQSQAKQQNKNCATCHMPAITRKQSLQSYTAIEGRKHTWRGSRSKSLLKQSAKLSIQRSDEQVTVTVINETGHILPGDGLRAVILEVSFGNQKERQVFCAEIDTDRLKIKQELRLKEDEVKQVDFTIPLGQPVSAKLFYRFLPTTPEKEWLQIAEATAP